ncbi:N-6 DNA methylase [Dactylosporangium sp. NPDC051484]|uniref:type I restriction-modification system subunit M/S n=1 Tax=Dactylosporangium sp. NPDC051484 TaxID=3154942 RepID=UPI00344B41CD
MTNWERRYDDFPRPVLDRDRQLFNAVAVAAWLDGRRIPTNLLRNDESDGQDYGTRFRRTLGLSRPTDSTPPPQPMPAASRAAQWLLDRLDGPIQPNDVTWLAFLIYLRTQRPQIWSDVKTRAGDKQGWHLLEDVWRRTMAAEASSRDMSAPTDPPGDITIDRLGPAKTIMHIIDEAHCLLENESRPTSGRPPSAELLVNLMEKYAQAQGRRAQEYFTPRGIVKLTVDVLAPSAATTRMYDPFCRTGEFLDEAATRLASAPHESLILGQNPNRSLRSLAQMNLRLHGLDALVDDGYWWDAQTQDQQYDLIFTNPPFNMRLPEGVVETRSWLYGPPPTHNGNFAWLQHVVSRLGPGGRAGVIMPNNAGLSTNIREHTIRAAMIEDGAVECVIGLPSRLFAGTSISVSLWLLRKPSGTPGNVLFIDATELGTNAARGVRTLPANDAGRIIAVHDRWRRGEPVSELGFARSVSIAELRVSDHALNPAAYVGPSLSVSDQLSEHARTAELLQHSSALMKRLHLLDDEVRQLTAPLDATRRLETSWRTLPLGELCVLKAGPSGSELRADVQRQNGIRIVLPKHLRNGFIADTAPTAVSEELARRLPGYRLEVDDLVVARTVEFGRVARVSPEQQGWLFSAGLIRLRTKDGILPSYLAHALASPVSREWMKRHATGTVVTAITITTLAKLPVAVPSLEEQERLSIALEAITAQVRVHAELANITQSLLDTLAQTLFIVHDSRQANE